ncbi:MAG: radical SAM protein [Candidatus Methanoperedens sp.]|nr:radical SAM protein [Candidatus Methanoperedens sp.]
MGREVIPPLGLLKIAALPDKNGHEVKIFDGNLIAETKIKKEILKRNPEFIGITTFTGPILKGALEISRFAKENTEAKVIWGGVHASLLPFQVINEDCVDIVVLREGDYTLNEIIENKNNLEKVRGIIYKEHSKIYNTGDRGLIEDIDQLPLTPWHLIDATKYIASWGDAKRTLPLITSRGCPYRCAFCYNTEFNKRKWRNYSTENICRELDYLISNYPIDGVRIMADNFIGLNRNKSIEISECINKRGLLWSCLLRVDQTNRNILETYKKNGCTYIFYGIESGSPRILSLIQKDITLEQVKRIIGITKELKIRHAAGFMYDFPTETYKDLKATLELIDDLDTYVMLSAFQPYPGNSLFNYCLEHSLIEFPKKTTGWTVFDYSKVHGLSSIPKDNLKELSQRLNSRYNYYHNIKVASTKGDITMLASMGGHVLESFTRNLNQFG